ncbi:TAXI family TRAP transporter solute-binding subunit [Halodurantibacterium flavum]|uniref:TAXI family TRAP transporter solute-binding subunit n=1 Tax=Halodurantibacterium flavum TaxID=1382802 RepID=A0ABW4SB26_9RHOB
MKRTGLALVAAMSLASTASAYELSIATGGTGGVYYPYGGGLAELINRHVEGHTASAEVTGASVENMALISRGDSDIATVLADTAYAAYNGTDPFAERPMPETRALASIYPNAVQLVVLADSPINSLADLRGQRVSVGAPGSGTEVNAQALLEANGITYDDFTAERLNFNETADALRDGDIVAGFWSVGPPTSSIMNLAATRSIRIIPISDEEIAAAVELEPVFSAYTLAAGTYDGMTEDVQTIAIPNVLVVHEDMEEELAYEITRVLFERVDELIAIHPAANDTTVEFSLSSTPVPLHPGAIRYYQEIGAEVPEHLMP